MGKIIKSIIVSVLIWMASLPMSAWADRGYIYKSVGNVTVAYGRHASRPAVKNEMVTSGMYIRTGNRSHAILKFEDGQVVSIQSNSTFQVREYTYNPQQVEKSNIVFSLFKGGMHFISGLIGQRNPKAFRLSTPMATIGIRGTDFMVVQTTQGLYSQVISGTITVTNAAGMTVYNAGNAGLTSSSTTLSTKVTLGDIPADAFSNIASISVPPAVPGVIPPPEPFPITTYEPITPLAPPTPSAATSQDNNKKAPAMMGTTSGGSEAGGATASLGSSAGGAAAGSSNTAITTTAVAAGATSTGVSGSTIAIGAGVAAGAAAIISTSTTSH